MKYIDNQQDLRLRGLGGFNSFGNCTSSSRLQMLSSAISQHLVISGCRPNTIQTGIEQEFGKYTYSVITEHNLRIVAIIDRYIPSPNNGIQFNPQRVVIYQTFDEDNTPLYGMLDITRTFSNHSKFGFEYKRTKEADNIRLDATIPKGTILYDTPAKDELGNYSPGRDLNVVFTSLEGTIEDSILISKSAVSNLKIKTYITRNFELGESEFPLNLYGNEEEYKVMPDIGEYCTPTGQAYNGILMAKRQYNPMLTPITFTNNTTRKFSEITDVCLDGGGSSARVVDIVVYKQPRANTALAPKVLKQLDKYAYAYQHFCKRILDQYKQIQAKHNGKARFTDTLDWLIKHAMAICNEPSSDDKARGIPITKTDNYSRKLDDIYISITTEVEKEVGAGFKMTGYSGDKGVIARVVDPEEMPYDPIRKVRADVAISPETTLNRMNPSRNYEQTLKTAMVELEEWLRNKTNINSSTLTYKQLKEKVYSLDKSILEDCFSRIERFLELTVPIQYNEYKNYSFHEKTEDLYHILKDRFYLYRPTDNPLDILEMFEDLLKEGFLSPPNHLEYYNPYTGKIETTKVPHRIGPIYFIFLEKIGDTGSAVSTANVQPNGVLASMTSSSKANLQVRAQPTRFPGESEGRTLVAGGPSGLAAAIHDRSNNPKALQDALEIIYQADYPTDIDVAFDENKNPLGNDRSIQMLKQYLQCQGVEMVYKEFDPNLQRESALDPITGKPVEEIGIIEEES